MTNQAQLDKVTVTKLFGVFDHVIPLSTQGITVIHGINGIGKTVLLRMINDVLRRDVAFLLQVPFERLELVFSNKSSLVIVPTREPGQDTATQLSYRSTAPGKPPATAVVPGAFQFPESTAQQIYEHITPSWRRQPDGMWIDRSDGEMITEEEFFERYGGRMPPSLAKRVRDSAQQHKTTLTPVYALLPNLSVWLIEANRLESSTRPLTEGDPYEIARFTYRRYKRVHSSATIEHSASDLVKRIREVDVAYATLSAQLDRSFPRRVLEKSDTADTKELLNELKDMEERRKKLTELGLLAHPAKGRSVRPHAERGRGFDATSEDIWPLVEQIEADPEGLLAQKVHILAVYLGDTKEKLAVFRDISARIDLFLKVVNRRFSHKRMSISRENGFQFSPIMPDGTFADDLLSLDELSSGEQHKVVVAYELLFRAPDAFQEVDGGLIVIDEPEISLHIEWQQTFVHDLRTILNLSKARVNCLMATHSHIIISGAYDLLAHDLLVELHGPAEKNSSGSTDA